MTDLTVENYSDKSVVVRGDTKSHKDGLAKLAGKWNASLQGGPGWIFSKKKEADVLAFIKSLKADSDEEKEKD